MSEYRKELLKSAIVAIMSASLLGAATYYLVQPGYRPISVAFALVEGRQSSGNCSVAFGCWLDLNFTFLNGSVITKSPLPPLEELCLGKPIPDEYSGEFNVTELQKITLTVRDFSGFSDFDKSILKVLVACLEDRTINVTMLDQEMTDLGSSKSFSGIWGTSTSRDGGAPGEPYIENKTEFDELKSSFNVTGKALESSTGYWKTTDYIWEITTNQLGDMLQGSGTTNITFMMHINMELKYKITTTSEETLTGNAHLSWSGRWGTLQLTHEEGKIFWVKYNFTTVKLIMIVTE